jgi:alpha-L-rhamnosidase
MTRRQFFTGSANLSAWRGWKNLFQLALLGCAAILCAKTSAASVSEPVPPVVSPAETRRFSATDYGATGDGQTLNTVALQKAIDDIAAKGGGTLRIPPGTFVTGSIFLKPGVNLHLAAGAVLKGSTTLKDYPAVITRIEGLQQPLVAALINASNCPHLRIDGAGTIDGSGKPFWVAFWQAITRNPRTMNVEVKRPRLMFLEQCHDARIAGLHLKNSGFWNVHVYGCDHLVIDGLDISAPHTGLRSGAEIAGKNWRELGDVRAPSSDGIDVDSCQHVIIRNCSFGVDDDDIALKGSKGPFAPADTNSAPVEDVLIEHCTFRYGHGCLTFGSEATVVRNVIMQHCDVLGGQTLLRLKLRTDTPQTYANVLLEDITANPSGQLIAASPWTQYANLHGQPQPRSQVENITLRHIRGHVKGFVTLSNHAHSHIRNIQLEDINVQADEPELNEGTGVSGLEFSNVLVNGQPPRIRNHAK